VTTSSDRSQRITLGRFVPTGDMSGLKNGRSFIGAAPPKNLAYVLWARAPEMPPNSHQQPAIATSSKPANMKLARALDLRATHENTLVMRRSQVTGIRDNFSGART
jgi:hypothetical protein